MTRFTYTVYFHSTDYNQHKSHPQYVNRHCQSRFAASFADVPAIIAEGEARGWKFTRVVCNNTGRAVNA